MNSYLARLMTAVLFSWISVLPATAAGPVLPQHGIMNRDTLVRAVIAENPGIEALRSAESAAIARIEPAGALDDPMLSTGLTPLQFGGDGMADRSYTLELSQSLPWPGKLADRADTARAKSRVAGAEIEILKLGLAETAAAAYAEWVFVDRALTINRNHQQLLIELRATAETQYAAGRGAQQDVLQADTELHLLQNRELELERRRDELRARINGLLNRRPDRPLPAPAGLGAPLAPLPYETLAELAHVSHPELNRIEHQIGGRQAEVELAQKEFYPDFRVSAGYNSIWGDPKQRPMIGLAVNVPLDQSKRRAALSAARAELQESRWRLVDRRSRLLAELEASRAAVFEAVRSYELYRDELLPLAKDMLEAAVADYTAGRGDFLGIVSAERNNLNTELALARTLADYHRRLAALERAVGRRLAAERPLAEAATLDIPAVMPREEDQ